MAEAISSAAPDFFLFVQHGWADDQRAMVALAEQLVSNPAAIVAPNLGYIQTWIRIAPLIQQVDTIATAYLRDYPDVPLRIIGHSMGGLIWLEVLHRHPDWWPRVHSLVLVGSPVGGADLGRIIDPLKVGLGIATDLGIDRKSIAEQIAAAIPTLVIAGDIDQGSDGTVTLACTRFDQAHFICLPESHPALRNHPSVAAVIRDFWADFSICETIAIDPIIQRLRAVPGMTDGHLRNFSQAKIAFHLKTGNTIRLWQSPFGVDHVYVASPDGACLYAGFVGWVHSSDLKRALYQIQQDSGFFYDW
jgi:hypothetical protein